MAHAAAHIKKARSEMDQPPDLKALEKARERRRRSRERAERKRKVSGRHTGITQPFITLRFVTSRSPLHTIIITITVTLSLLKTMTACCQGLQKKSLSETTFVFIFFPPPLHHHLMVITCIIKSKETLV